MELDAWDQSRVRRKRSVTRYTAPCGGREV